MEHWTKSKHGPKAKHDFFRVDIVENEDHRQPALWTAADAYSSMTTESKVRDGLIMLSPFYEDQALAIA